MSDVKIDHRKFILLKKSNELLERTKKNYKNFEKERKLLLELTTNTSIDYNEWEKILVSIEELVDSYKEEGGIL